MSQSAGARAEDKKTATDSLFAATVGQLLAFASWFLFAIFVSIVIEWAGMLFGWWNAGHARQMLLSEIEYLSHIDRNLLLGAHPAGLASSGLSWMNTGYAWLGVDKGLSLLEQHVPLVYVAVSSGVDITYTLAVRLATVILAIPAFILWGIVALIDGLVDRDIRRACGGVESSFVYHRVKAWVKPAVALSAGLYLTLPVSIDPALFFLVPQTLFFLAVYYTAASFKKFI